MEKIKDMKTKTDSKIQELKKAVKDKQFNNDLIEIAEDFKIVDLENW